MGFGAHAVGCSIWTPPDLLFPQQRPYHLTHGAASREFGWPFLSIYRCDFSETAWDLFPPLDFGIASRTLASAPVVCLTDRVRNGTYSSRSYAATAANSFFFGILIWVVMIAVWRSALRSIVWCLIGMFLLTVPFAFDINIGSHDLTVRGLIGIVAGSVLSLCISAGWHRLRRP